MIRFRVAGGEIGGVEMRGVVKKAMLSALEGAKSDAAEAITRRYISPEIGVSKLKARVSGGVGMLSARGRKQPLKMFEISPRRRLNPQPKSGVYARVLRKAGFQMRSAFIGKRSMVFQRETRRRYPIRAIMGVSAAQMLESAPVVKHVVSQFEKRFKRNLERQITSAFS